MAITTLVNQIKEKDEEAFEQIYNDYNKLVFYVVYQIVKNKEATNDLVQDTFLTIYRKIDQYNGGNFKYWILQIAKNLAINYYNRVMKKEEQIVKSMELIEKIEDTKAPGLGKYDELLNKHFTQTEKDLIVYHVVFGYSYKEISQMLGENAKVIGKKCRRLLSILKNIVEED